jgi:hypothetical protein
MDLLGTLGVALGLAMLAGINLYLTIFITGLAVKLSWFHDSGLAAALEGFGHPAVIAVSLGLFVVQFIADKIPWVDSLWDSIHTFLKPAGGVLLALTSLGADAGVLSQFFVAMLALTGSLLTHGVKASARLSINTSPEPFSNIGASVAEDLLVVGGFMLLINNPTAAFFVFALALALFVYLTPRVTRTIRAILWLIWKKLRVPAGDQSAGTKDLPSKLSADAESLLLDEFGSEGYKVAWCVPCVTGKTRNTGRLCRNLFGDLIAIRERSGKVFFVGSRNFKKFIETIELSGALATHESRFLSEGIVIHNKKSKLHANVRFHRGQEELAERIADYLQDRIAVVDARDTAAESEAEAADAKKTSDADKPESVPPPDEKPDEKPDAPSSLPEEDAPTPDGPDDGDPANRPPKKSELPPISSLSPIAPLSPLGDDAATKPDSEEREGKED